MSNLSGAYHGRVDVAIEQEVFLNKNAGLYNHVKHCLYADMQKTGKAARDFKKEYLIKFGITARHFSYIAIDLEGMIKGAMELLTFQKQELETKIKKTKKVIGKIRNKEKKHQKKRQLNNLETRLIAINQQVRDKDPHICFGSKRLFKKQHNLEVNGYTCHEEWKADWDEYRNSQFYLVGCGAETTGNTNCNLFANIDGSFDFKIRSVTKEANYIYIRNVVIANGAGIIREALRTGQALTYRFLRDNKSWRVIVTTDRPEVKQASIKVSGAIGIDINADCLGISETDRFGNLIKSYVLPLVTYGKSSDQAEAIIGDTVKQAVALAVDAKKPIIIEKLNFSKKKAELEGEKPKYARMLSSFAYNKIVEAIKSRSHKFGIEVIRVNPAYTSTIGACFYAQRYGISTHQAAALAIARRGLGLSEKPAKRLVIAPERNGGHVALPVPVRILGKHVWTQLAALRKSLLAAHVVHFRSGDYKYPPAPLRKRTDVRLMLQRSNVLSSIRNLRARLPHANSQVICSPGVIDDIPW